MKQTNNEREHVYNNNKLLNVINIIKSRRLIFIVD